MSADGEHDGGWGQDPAVHDRVREAEEARAAVRAEQDQHAPDPRTRMARCFDRPPEDAA